MSLELVLVVPVLVLLTVFVLWAGRGGRAALTADLAAEEAATAAALCCEEGAGGAGGREALVEDVLEARPGLGFLCIGGLRPGAEADGGVGPDEFLREDWLEFEPGRGAGGVGVLGVQFLCESDGAVAPLRGLFPTVTFYGQASEVVLREPRFIVGFEPTHVEVEEGPDSQLVFTVRVQPAQGQEVTLTYRLDQLATTAEPQDFVSGVSGFAELDQFELSGPHLVGTVEIPANADSAQIVLPLVDDDFFEGTEQLVLELTGADPPPLLLDEDRIQAAGVIEDNDPEPFLQILPPDPEVDEGGDPADPDDGDLVFRVRLGGVDGLEAPNAGEVTVQVSTVADPAAERLDCATWMDSADPCEWASPSDDYVPVSAQQLTFPAGVQPDGGLTLEVLVRTLDDKASPESESTEVVVLKLRNGSGAPVRQGYRLRGGRILDDEATVSVADASVLEGDPPPGVRGDPVVFRVTLDKVPAADVTLDYTFEPDGRPDARRATQATGSSCMDGHDYLGPTDQVTVRAFSQQATFEVQTCGDVVVERDETFWVGLSRATSGGEVVVPDGTGAWGTIRNDDIPMVSIEPAPADATGAEGQDAPLGFTVSLTVGGQPAQLGEDITVDYEIGGGTATAPGQADADYAVTLGTATPPELSGSTLEGTLTFTAGTSGTPPVTEHLFEAVLRADYLLEGDETFQLDLDNLRDPVGAAVFEDPDGDPSTDDSYAVGTIEDDPPPVLSVTGFTGPEGSDRSFVVSLADARPGETVTVDYVIAGAGVDPAGAPGDLTEPVDFEPVPDTDPFTGDLTDLLTGTLTLDESTLSVSVEVSLLGDAIHERSETLRLTLHTPTGAVLLDHDPLALGVQAYAQGTITNVDSPWLSVDNTSTREGELLEFTVTLCNPIPGESLSVWYRTLAHSAATNVDFDLTFGTVGFWANTPARTDSQVCGDGVDAKSQTAQVRTRNDSVEESDEEVHLELYNPSSSVAFAKSIGVGRIINVSAATVRVNDPTAVEGSPLGFEITLVDNDGDPAVITAPVTVHYATADRTAAAADYTPVPANPGPCLSAAAPPAGCPSVTFDPADNPTPANPDPANRRHTASVPTTADLLDEDDETVALVLRLAEGTGNAGLGDTEGTGTIEDADPPALRINDATAVEGESMTFTVTLGIRDNNGDFVERETSEEVTVFAATEDGTATAGDDYTARSRLLTIPAGDTRASVPLTVATILDDVPEAHETFRVVLSEATNAKLDRAVAEGTINPRCVHVDINDADNQPPTITVHDWVGLEGEGYWVALSFSRPLCDPFTLSLRVEADTATCWVDLGCYTNDAFAREASQSESQYPRAHLSGTVLEDTLDEEDEQAVIRVGWASDMPPHYWTEPEYLGSITIVDDDDPPAVSVADASADEGDPVTFTISLDSESFLPVTVEYRTVPGSGSATGGNDPTVAGVDYTEVGWTSVTLTPAVGGQVPSDRTPGQTEFSFTVETVDDGSGDSGETFLVELRAPPDPATPINALIVDGVAVGTILEGDLPELRIRDASADEGDTMRLQVELSEVAAQTVTVDYFTVERPEDLRAAVEGADADYVPVVQGQPEGQLEFQPNETVKFAEVTVNSDQDREVDETFLVELANPSGAALADPSAVGTINGDTTCVDALGTVAPTLTVDSPAVDEGDGVMIFTATLDQPYCQSRDLVILTSRLAGDATPYVDYTLRFGDSNFQPSGGTFLPLRTSTVFFLNIVDDDIAERDETVIVPVAIGSNVTAEASGTILDNDQASVSVADVSGVEGGFLNFVIRLDRPSSREVTVAYATEDASPLSAEAGADYRARSNIAVIPPGELLASVAVFAPQDRLNEDSETFQLRLSNPTGGASVADADAVATGTIVDDDPPPVVRVSDASTGEGGALVFAVILDAPSGREVVVPVSTRDGTARAADGDYEPRASRDVVFAPGVTRQTVRVRTLDDSVVESPETMFLDLGPMRNATATIDKGIGRGVIRDVSDRRVSVSDAFVVEGGTLAFEVGFSEGASSRDVVVRYRTRAGTAAAGGDYDGSFEVVSRELRIVAGDTSAMVLVPTVEDSLDEDSESLELVLSDPQGAVIVAGAASGVIIDDDPLPALSVGDVEVSEGVGVSAVFTLSLSELSGRRVTVSYSTADVTAVAGDDYTAVPSGEMVIDAGHRQATVDVALVDDDDAEEVETFQLQVSGITNASRDDSVGVATITDDDGLVQVLVDDPAAVYEGEGVSAVFTVRLGRAHTTEAVTVAYSTADGNAVAGSDYTAASGTLTFAAGDIAATVSVALVNDDTVEDPETFRLRLSNPSSNAELGDGEASVLIRDDDGLPTVSVADAAAQTEGSTASFAVTLSRAVPQEVTVDYAAVVDPLATDEAAATPGQDYTAVSGTLRFAARATEATVTVPLLDDSFDEHTETFWLRLASPVGASIVDGTATGTIADDDPLPEISIGDAGATEGSPLGFEVRLTPVSGRTVTVPWATEALPAGVDSASPGADYTAAAGTLTLAPGATTERVEVATLPDDISEADERFLVQLGTPTNGALDDGTAVGAIRDDDGLPRISIADATVDEDAGPAIFSVTLSHPSSQPVTVGYATADGTADSPPADPYDFAPDEVRTLTIPAAFTAAEISVFIADDDLAEGTETFTVTLTDPVNAVIAEGAGTATGYILDDEGRPRLSVSDAEECEDGSSLADCEVRSCRTAISWTIEEYMACQPILADPGACQEGMCGGDGILEFAVQLSHASTEETSVRYSTFVGSAASPRDYVATTGTLTIPIGDTTASIPVTLVDDGVHELQTETFRLVLDNPVGVELETEQATGTIRNDDPPPRVAAEPFDAFSNENDGFAYHRVTLSHPSDLTVTVDYGFEAVLDRSGNAGIDTTPGTLTFAPGVVEQTLGVPLFDNNVSTYTPGWTWRYANTSYRAVLSDRVNASYGFDTSTGVVWDDETPPYVESVTAQNTLESAGAAVFTITLHRFSDTAVTATYETVAGTATAGTDYSATEATVMFPPGTITATVTVPILDDTDVESDESFTLRIINDARNSNLTYLAAPLPDGHGTGSGSVLIIDDDTMPEISVTDTEANENAGTMAFWVSLSRASANGVTVHYTTADGTATASDDYTAADDTLTIPAGATGASVSVTIIDDTDDTESDETFTLNLSGATGATITDTSATATIIEDSNLPAMTVHDESRTENIAQTSRFMGFAFSLSQPLTRTMTIDWQVVEVPSLGDEAATLGADFFGPSASNGVTTTSPTSGEFRVDAGRFGNSVSNLLSFSFTIVADMVPERDERFQLILSNPRGVTLTRTHVWGTILNDDVPIVSVADVQASESDDAVVFTLQLHEPGVDPASLHYTTVVRTSAADAAASPGDDYTTASGILNIPTGDTTATISVPIIADTADEEDETFLLVLTNPDSLEFRDRVAVGTITDDDPGFWIRDRSVWENAATMDFIVQRDHTSTNAVTVNYRIGTGGSATGGTACTVDGADYVTPSGTVTIPAAATEAAISIEICNDDDAEGRENLLVELTNVTGRQTTAVGTIVDDDRTDLPRINIGDSASRAETVHATLGAQFQITVDRVLRGDATVTWRTEDCLATDTVCPHPATAGTDYTAASGTVTLTPTNPSATVTVAVADDTTDEDNEQFFVRITGVTDPAVIGSGATHADPVGIGRITDDDGQPTLYVRDSCAVEGDVARIPVVLSHAHTSHIFGWLRVTGGTAIRRDDIGRIGALNLSERDTTDYVEIEVIQDNITEGTETLELELDLDPRYLTGIELGDSTATLTIREDSCN